MAAKVFESIGKFGLTLAVAGGVVNSALYNDLQNVNITLRILFRPVTSQLPRIFTSIGEDYDERVLPSITTERSSSQWWLALMLEN
uniref:Prohibitin n=1 Tax=Papio anubis TaxID=9555 RepID=A0A2I3M656_PAPAN